MAVKVLDSTGNGRESDVAFGLVWCATHGAKVVLMALSADPTETMKRAIGYAAGQDVLMVASAGNQGPCVDCVAFPARDSRVLAVGAVGSTLGLASFSSNGPQVALLAPGVNIASTFTGGKYAYGSGTSQAAAWVAGAAALVRDLHPGFSAQQTRAALVSGAGAGAMLDVDGALAAAQR